MNNKLYIPTTTLNFDNILSSESISPKSFYSNRGFGFGRWFEVAENDNSNVILLYDKLMGFSRPASDAEDHPLLIEVTLNERLKSLINKVDEGVYSCTETIYIDLWNTRFIFQSEREKQITLSLSDSSLETKVTRLYSKRMFVENLQGQYSLPQVIEVKEVINTSAIEYDIVINKFKGLLYGYYIGAILSASKSNIEQLTLLKELRNVIAAVASNIDGKPTSYQIDMIMTITSKLNNFDYHQQALKQIISNKAEYLKTIEYLISKNLLRSRFDGNAILQSLNTINYKKEVNSNDMIEFVNHQIETIKSRINKDCTPLNPDLGEIIVSDKKLHTINKQSFQSIVEKDLYKVWVNEIFISSQYNNKINYYKDALTDTLTIRAKELLQDQWESSDIKVVMNKLRRHIRGESFNIEWNNGLISSLAAVVTNGENWSKLLSFMQQKGMYDYRIAFSIYGMLNGFANLTRDFTDIILNYDKHYVADVYKEFYGQLFGISIDIIRDDSIVKDTHGIGSLYSGYGLIGSQANQVQIQDANHLSKRELTKGQHYNDERYISEDYDILKSYLKSKKVVKKKQDGVEVPVIYDNIIEKCKRHSGVWKSAFQDMIDDKTNGITQVIIDRICAELDLPTWKQNIQKKQNSKKKHQNINLGNKGLFSEEFHSDNNNIRSGTELYKDENFLENLSEFISGNSKFQNDIEWFVKEYRLEQKSTRDGYRSARRDNASIIEHLRKYLIKNNHIPTVVDKVINKLKSIYL